MKTAIIDAGGGMKGCYGAGVVEYMIDHGINPDIAIGVSAGSSNLITLKSKQKGRLLRFYRDYPYRKEYMGLGELLRHHSFMNVKYIFEELSMPGKEDALDFDAIAENPMDFYLVATDAETGKPVYFNPDSFNPYLHEASCNLPILNQPIVYEGREYYDGGVSDPIPWRKAFELGADKIIVVLTRPETIPRDPKRDEKLSRLLEKKYPNTARALKMRAFTYNQEVADMAPYRKDGKILVLSPDNTCGVTTTRHRKEDIEALYRKGMKDAERISGFLEN